MCRTRFSCNIKAFSIHSNYCNFKHAKINIRKMVSRVETPDQGFWPLLRQFYPVTKYSPFSSLITLVWRKIQLKCKCERVPRTYTHF